MSEVRYFIWQQNPMFFIAIKDEEVYSYYSGQWGKVKLLQVSVQYVMSMGNIKEIPKLSLLVVYGIPQME